MTYNPEITIAYEETERAARGTNQSAMRAHNERLVLTLIRERGPLAKAEIARITGLSAQAISVIMRQLEAERLLARGEPVRGRVGQPSVPMRLDPDGAYFLGLKVGRRSVDLVLLDFLGRIMDRVHQPHRYPDPDDVVRFATDAVARVLGPLTGAQRGRVAGLGIAIPFRLWEWAEPLRVAPAIMDRWRDRDIRAEIGSPWDFPVYLENDASAACGAELVFGAADRPSDFLYFFVGFFIGGGLVMNDTLITGRTGNAASMGTMPVGWDGGRAEKLIDVASLSLLEMAVDRAGGDGSAIWDDPGAWNVADSVIDAWLDRAASGLARATASAATVFDFEAALIDGWLPPGIRRELVARVARNLSGFDLPGIDLPAVREGTIGSDARSIGAASLPLSDRFLIGRSAPGRA